MSNTWPPQQEPPPQSERPHRQRADESRFPQYPQVPRGAPHPYGMRGLYGSQPSQPPSYGEADSGYGRYGTPGPSSAGRPGGRSPQRGEPRSQGGGAPAPEQYQPGQPPPYYPQYPDASSGAPYPYGIQNPYGVRDPYGLRDPYGSQPPPSPRSGYSLVEVVVLLVIAIVITAGGTWALTRYGPFATTQTTTAPGTAASQVPGTPAAGLHLYTSTAVGVQFDMPDGWITENVGSSTVPTVQASSPDGKALMVAGVAFGRGGNEVAVANAEMAGLADPGTLGNKEGPSQATFGGATWVREAADLTRSGVRLHAVVFVATHGLNLYSLFFVATTSSFAADNARYFQATTQSFRFLS